MSNKMFKEGYIFANLKDRYFKNADEFKGIIIRDFKDVDCDISALYRKIVNYQIKKYGRNLSGDHRDLVPLEKLQKRANKRKVMKKNYWGLHKEESKCMNN